MTETPAAYVTTPQAHPVFTELDPLADWERRLLIHARLLRSQGKSVMFMVRFDGAAMTFWKVAPDGRFE